MKQVLSTLSLPVPPPLLSLPQPALGLISFSFLFSFFLPTDLSPHVCFFGFSSPSPILFVEKLLSDAQQPRPPSVCNSLRPSVCTSLRPAVLIPPLGILSICLSQFFLSSCFPVSLRHALTPALTPPPPPARPFLRGTPCEEQKVPLPPRKLPIRAEVAQHVNLRPKTSDA